MKARTGDSPGPAERQAYHMLASAQIMVGKGSYKVGGNGEATQRRQ